MLELVLNNEYYDEERQQFVYSNICVVHLEHSLYTISKWESKWKKPFLNSEKKGEELLDYIKCMCQEDISEDIIRNFSSEEINKIRDYIDDPMSATTISRKDKRGGGNRVVTAELIYYWMIASNIPFECQHWHLNRLLKLIEVCSVEANPQKMGKQDILKQNRELNAARRKALKSKG